MLQIPAKMLITVRMALALAHTWRSKFSRGPLHLDWKYQDELSKAVVVLVVVIWKRWGNLIPHYLVLIKRLLPRTRMSRQRIRCLLRRARWSHCWWWRVLQQCQCRFTPSTSRWRYWWPGISGNSSRCTWAQIKWMWLRHEPLSYVSGGWTCVAHDIYFESPVKTRQNMFNLGELTASLQTVSATAGKRQHSFNKFTPAWVTRYTARLSWKSMPSNCSHCVHYRIR